MRRSFLKLQAVCLLMGIVTVLALNSGAGVPVREEGAGSHIPVSAPAPTPPKAHWFDTTLVWGERVVKAVAIAGAL